MASFKKRLSEEHKRKIGLANSIALKGIKKGPCSEETKKKISKTLMGQKLSEERKNKISKTVIKKNGSNPKPRGQWKIERDRFKYSSEGMLWRTSVFLRDNFTCQKCNIRGTELHAHHILNFNDNPDYRANIAYGITLCKKCHLHFHSKYGKVHNTKEQIKGWLE